MKKLYLDYNYGSEWKEVLTPACFNVSVGYFMKLAYNEYTIVNCVDDCDIYITECSNLNIIDNKLNIIICGESDDFFNYYKIMEKYKHASNIKFIGTVEDSNISFNIPLQYRQAINGDFYTLNVIPDTYLPSFKNRINRICFMRRKCLLEKKQLRENLAKKFNVEYVNGDDKLSIIKQYLINFCAENSLSKFNGNTGYITEKIYDASAAKCIPLYYGGDLNKYSILNPNRIIQLNTGTDLINDYQNIINNLSIEQLEQMYNMPILRADYNDFVMMRKLLFKKFMTI